MTGYANKSTTRPVQDYDVLVDRQFNQIKQLLETSKRQRVEARAKIRGLLAIKGHIADDVRVSERDVSRVEKAVKNGKGIDEVFSRLRNIQLVAMGDGPSVTVKIVKKGGAPVTLAPADDPNATAVREVDLQKQFHWQAKDLARSAQRPREREGWLIAYRLTRVPYPGSVV